MAGAKYAFGIGWDAGLERGIQLGLELGVEAGRQEERERQNRRLHGVTDLLRAAGAIGREPR